MANAIVVGTSHVSQESVERVRESIEKFKPDVVCIELDEKRYNALKTGKRITFGEAVKNKIYFLYFFSMLQHYIGKKAGNKPGLDMLMAAEIAKESNIPVALIDKDARDIANDIKNVPRKDKMKLMAALFTGALVPQKNVDIKKIPSDELIKEAMKEVKKISPAFYKALVTKRNLYMVKMIQRVINEKKAKKVLVVVGAGHKKEIGYMLNRRKIRTKVV